jgi:hypothetical protein
MWLVGGKCEAHARKDGSQLTAKSRVGQSLSDDPRRLIALIARTSEINAFVAAVLFMARYDSYSEQCLQGML